METKKKHSEEVEELNKSIDAIFDAIPQFCLKSLQDAIDQLLVLEKKSRLLIEPSISIRVTDKLLDLCFESKDFAKLNASILLLSKRRAQLDDVIAALVRKGMTYLPPIDDFDTKMALLKTLLDISDGKMFLEKERAQLIREVMRMKESKGDVEGAAAASQEIQVEVCNALSSREKAEFLLEQIRLSQLVHDWVRVPLTIQKVNVKVLKEERMDDLLEQFLALCVRQHVHDNDLKALFFDFQHMLALKRFEEDDAAARSVVQALVLLCVLMPFDAEQQSLLHALAAQYSRHWKYMTEYRSFLACFERTELLRWPLPTLQTVVRHALFTDAQYDAQSAAWKELLRKRVVEHNIRVLGKFVTEATLGRVSELLQLSEEAAEEALAEACSDGMLWLRMDRVKRTVVFKEPKEAEATLTEWTEDVKGVMNGLDRIVYLIEKERMMKEVGLWCVCFIRLRV
ncbi:hypothetical protein WA577_002006 [Blastocystis sp. JDR]